MSPPGHEYGHQIDPDGLGDRMRLVASRARRAVRGGGYDLEAFRRRRCIYVHIPKTAGLSVSRALFDSRAGGHRSLRAYEMTFGARRIADWYKFTFVRHPVDRFVSAARYLRSGGISAMDRAFSAEVMSAYASLDDFTTRWMTPEKTSSILFFIPQYEFVQPGPGGTAVDFIGRFESLTRDYAVVAERLSADPELPHENLARAWPESWSVLGDEGRALIEQIYERDFLEFGYEPEPGGEPGP